MRLHDLLDWHARERPDAEFGVQGERRLTYAEAGAQANRVANALAGAGCRPGTRVALLAKNCLEYAILYLGASKAGVVPVPLNYRLAPPEWQYIVDDAGAEVLIARGDLVAAIAPVCPELRTVRRRIAMDARADGWDEWAAWLAAHPATPPDVTIDDAADAYQMYTSGTTGRPKGAVLAHRAVMANIAQVTAASPFTGDERVLVVSPMYHAAAALTALATTYTGGSIVVQEDFLPGDVVRALSEERVARTMLVPAMIQACLALVPDVAERRYDTLRIITYGASPIAEAVLRRAMEVFRCGFTQGYGMTETASTLTWLTPEDHERALRGRPELLLSAGRALPGTDIRIVDEHDHEVPAGTVGEICGRGPQLMRGYWNLPEASAEALRGGWMHTGDAGRVDADGYVYIQDRVKDMIVSGGENIYPREVEDVLFQHPAVGDAAVIGVPDATFGESVRAIVVLRPGAAATVDEIMAFCRGRLGGYKRPRAVEFVTALPRNPSGKILKRELREPHWRGHTRRVG